MNEPKKVQIELDEIELEILIYSLGSSQPINKDTEIAQFKLYHRLIFKRNDLK